ncbi:MAG: DUF1456 family protein [Bdellovibrionaceae bacterium]|nr:DUF1456 family protein [Pseudobdellovibrionaceae bacterium]
MMSNDVMRSLRYILNVNDQKLVDIIALAGGAVSLADMQKMLLSDEHVNYLKCSDQVMAQFLDGLIYFRRGKDESKPPMPFELPVTNNLVLKKLRVAFELKEDDMLAILKSTQYEIGRSELSALMRKKDHPNYRPCGDQILRYFLKGLQLKVRP